MHKPPRKAALPPYPTADELSKVRKHWLLGLLLDAFESDKKHIGASGIKTFGPYISLIDRAMDDVTLEIKTLSIFMRTAGIKKHSEMRDSQGFGYEYVCRGYTGKFYILNGFLAATLAIEKRRFLSEDISKHQE